MSNPYDDAVLADNPDLYYPLRERGGATAAELANDPGLDGTYETGADPDVDGPFPGIGNVGAVEFDATGDQVSIAPFTVGNGRTFEMWVSPDAYPGSGVAYIAAGADTAGDMDTIAIAIDTLGRVYVEVALGAGGSRWCRNNSALSNDGTWHFVTVVIESNLITVWVDGDNSSLTPGGSATLSTFTTDAQCIGGDTGFGLPAMIGRVGSFSVFPTALTGQELEAHWTGAQQAGEVTPDHVRVIGGAASGVLTDG